MSNVFAIQQLGGILKDFAF